MQSNHDHLHQISIVAAQTWFLQVCQLGLHLVQHTCVHHAEGKSNEFQCPLYRFSFCNSVFTFAFIFIHPWQKIEGNSQYVFGSQSNGRIFGAESICNKANNWLFCGLWERCEGNHFYRQKVQVSVDIYIWMLLHSYCGKYNWQDRQLREFLALLEPGIKIRIRAFCCRQREQMTPKTPRTPEFVQINYSDFRGLQKTPLSGVENYQKL